MRNARWGGVVHGRSGLRGCARLLAGPQLRRHKVTARPAGEPCVGKMEPTGNPRSPAGSAGGERRDVLVAFLPSPRDLKLAREQHWYRVLWRVLMTMLSSAPVTHIQLIHWHPGEAEARAAVLQAAGYEVTAGPMDPGVARALQAEPPGAVVIDLGRLPSQGRDAGLMLRKPRATRHVPLVFVGGLPEKVARVREMLPDAVYTTWEEIEDALAYALAHPLADPVVPRSTLDGYAGAPLAKKVGIREGSRIGLVGAPAGFGAVLGELPAGASVREGVGAPCDLILWFPRSREDMEEGILAVGAAMGRDGLWVVWPKKASGISSDLTQPVVRAIGLATGLVDYKVAAINDTWTGLRFTRRASSARRRGSGGRESGAR